MRIYLLYERLNLKAIVSKEKAKPEKLHLIFLQDLQRFNASIFSYSISSLLHYPNIQVPTNLIVDAEISD